MTEQDVADARKLAELLERDPGARECLAVITGETPLTIDSWCSCYGGGDEGVRKPEFDADPDPDPNEIARAFRDLPLRSTTPSIDPKVTAEEVDQLGAAWVERSAP
jgi:hypothetical protein